ncbi:Inositol phosphatase SIW14 [Exophiala dermatitidis]|nr:Inositol phosphatase SIW14 [Exophiala dermatitidis]
MATAITNNPSDPAAVLRVAQKAPAILAKASSVSTTFPASIFSSADSTELWRDVEQLLYACLRTGDDESAFLCVERLNDRFGPNNERVMAMRGLYQEAVATDEAALRKILEDYTKVLQENPMNVPIHKRRIALVKSLGRIQDAINHMVQFVDSFPTDIEAWCELSDLYESQGCIQQAIFSLEEAIIITPNAWNLHARLATSTTDNGEVQKRLTQAIRRFSRSIELCDDYLRGFYGLKLATERLLEASSSAKANAEVAITPEKLQKLSRLATSRLEAIVNDRSTRRPLGGTDAEVIAAQQLLNKSKS